MRSFLCLASISEFIFELVKKLAETHCSAGLFESTTSSHGWELREAARRSIVFRIDPVQVEDLCKCFKKVKVENFPYPLKKAKHQHLPSQK